jgi:hypothetical protein
MLEPKALPSAMPGLFWNAESAETTISGADVPNPTITIPIKSGGMPKYRAVEAAPSTNRSALHTRRAKPEIKASNASIIFFYFKPFTKLIFPDGVVAFIADFW